MASPSRSSSDASHTVSALLASSFSLLTSSCFSAGISYLGLKFFSISIENSFSSGREYVRNLRGL